MGAIKIHAGNMDIKGKKKRNKGIIYSLLTLFLITPSIILIIFYSNTLAIEGENFSSRVRADSLNNFYNSLLTDLERSLRISTFRALLHVTDVVDTSGLPFSNSEDRISEMVFKGTLDGVDVPSLNGTDDSPCNTILCWQQTYSNLAKQAGFDFSIEVISVSVKPYNSWNLNSSAEIKITLHDAASSITLRKTVTQSSIVPVTGFEDPLYLLNTHGKVTRLIKKPGASSAIRGDQGFGWALGSIEIDVAAGNHNKILLADDLSKVTSDQLETFSGSIFKETINDISHVSYIGKISSSESLTLGKKVFFENITNSTWNLNDEIINQNYHESYFGPSYLDRLEGRFTISDAFREQSPNAIGLVSFVDFSQLEAKGIPVDTTRSCVDYLYFAGKSNGLC